MSLPATLSVCVPTHQRRDSLLRLLASLRGQGPSVHPVAVDLLVVCNACTDGSAEAARGALSAGFPWAWRVLEGPELGSSQARNRAIRESRGEAMAFLDDDVQAEPGWLQGLLDCYANAPVDLLEGDVGLLWEERPRPAWLSREVESMLNRSFRGGQRRELFDGYVNGCNLSFRRDLVVKTGLFRRGLGRAGKALSSLNDVDWGMRAVRAGGRHYFDPAMKVWHQVPGARLERPYLKALAYQWGRSQVLLKEAPGAWVSLRSIVGRAWLWAAHAPLARWHEARNPEQGLNRHRFWAEMGKGGLRAWIERAQGTSPVEASEPYSLA